MTDDENRLCRVLEDCLEYYRHMLVFQANWNEDDYLYEVSARPDISIPTRRNAMKALCNMFDLNRISQINLPDQEHDYANHKCYLTKSTVKKLIGLHALGGIK